MMGHQFTSGPNPGVFPATTTSLADDLYEHALLADASELPIENLLTREEFQLALGDRDPHFPVHHLPLEMGGGVVLASAVVVLAAS